MTNNPENNQQNDESKLGLFDLLYLGLIDLSKLLQDIRFAAVLLVLVAVATLIGTALPQTPMTGDSAGEQLSKTFGENVYLKIIKPLGFDQVFRTTWYRFLMLLIVASVTLCAWARTKTASALSKKRSPVTSEKGISTFRFTGSENFKDKQSAVDWVTKNLPGSGYKLTSEEKGDEVHYFGQRNLTSKWMLVAMHYSFIFILLGAIAGGLLGSEEQAVIMEGETWSTKDNKATVRLNDYWMEFHQKDYPNEMALLSGGMPSDFKSQVDVLDENNQVLRDYTIEVNYPLSRSGYKFYQTSWGFEPVLSAYKNGELADRIIVENDTPFTLADSDKAFFIPFKQIVAGKLIKIDGQLEDIPPTCILYEVQLDQQDTGSTPIKPVTQAGGGTGIFRLGDSVEFTTASGVYKLAFDGMREYTVLQVKRDPGVGIVFFGFILCVLGGTWGLFLSYGTARAMIFKKEKNWVVKWGSSLPLIAHKEEEHGNIK
jgi:cytochrome c biogenesis protein